MELRRTFRAEAAHQLTSVPAAHKCSRLHGHSYAITVAVDGPVRDDGMVIDFGDIKAVVQPVIDRHIDHHYLNDILVNPTSERLCEWLWEVIAPRLPQLSAIDVSETCTSSCTYRGPQHEGNL